MNTNSLTVLHVVYIVAFVNGLVPFNFTVNPPEATRNRLYRLYAFFFITGFSVLTYTGSTVYVKLSMPKDSSNNVRPMYIVYMMLTTSSWIKTIWLSVIDLWNESELLQAVNEAIDLQFCINLLAKNSEELHILQHKIVKRSAVVLRVRLITLTGQLLILFGAIPFVPFGRQTKLSFRMFFRIYVTFIGVIRTTLQYVAFFVMWTFYFHLNLRLKIKSKLKFRCVRRTVFFHVRCRF